MTDYVFRQRPHWKPAPDTPLTEDLPLHSESVSMVNGHAGSHVIYLHQQRILCQETWVAREKRTLFGKPKVKTTSSQQDPALPPEIQARRQLMAYAWKNTSWIRRRKDFFGVLD